MKKLVAPSDLSNGKPMVFGKRRNVAFFTGDEISVSRCPGERISRNRKCKAGQDKVSECKNRCAQALKKWREKPETRAMFAQMAQERKEFIEKIYKQIRAQKAK